MEMVLHTQGATGIQPDPKIAELTKQGVSGALPTQVYQEQGTSLVCCQPLETAAAKGIWL